MAADKVRSVVVTGASTGIGRATALSLDSDGWRVFAGVRRDDDAAALAEAASERLVPLQLDITDSEQVAAAAERVTAALGGDGLDGLVNNAGITIPCPLEALPGEDFRRLLEVNVLGQVAVTQAMLPSLRDAPGRIVFVSSISGRRAIPMLAAYTASKAGLVAAADGFRLELRPWRIGVSLVEPGSIETPIWERGESEMEGALARSHIDVEGLYGKLIANFRTILDRAAARRIPPARVVAAIEHALTARRPRARYLVGLDARAQALGFRILPQGAIDRALVRVFDI